jgi:hypothetical protein
MSVSAATYGSIVKRHIAGQRASGSEMSVAFSVFDLARVDSGEYNLYPEFHVQS